MLLPRVSVVIPAHNAASTVAAAVGSVLSQLDTPVQILLIDDGSTDDTWRVASSRHAGIEILRKPRGGVSSARNLGIANAIGEYVAFLDADDAWRPGKLPHQVHVLDKHTEYVMCSTGAVLKDAAGNTIGMHQPARAGMLLPWLVGRGNGIITSSCVVRRSVLCELAPAFDEGLTFAEDYHLWLRIAARYRIAVLDAPLVEYRVSPPGKYNTDAVLSNLQRVFHLLARDPGAARQMARLWRDAHAGLSANRAESLANSGKHFRGLIAATAAVLSYPTTPRVSVAFVRCLVAALRRMGGLGRAATSGCAAFWL